MVLVFGVVLFSLLSAIYKFISPERFGDIWRYDVFQNLLLHIGILFILSIGLTMLNDFSKKQLPFSQKNIYLLKLTAIIAIVIEPSQYIVNTILNYYRPLNSDMTKSTFFITYGGIFVAIGLSLLCLSYIFEQGLILQVQSDETL